MLDPLVQLTIALSLAALLAASAAHKMRAWRELPQVVRNYRLVPDAFAFAVAGTVPCAEALAAAALLFPPARQAGGGAAAALLVTYAVAIGINLRRGRTSVDCGCFGSRPGQGIAAWMVWRNLLIAALALGLLVPTSGRALTAAEHTMAVVWVVTLAFLYPVPAIVLRSPPPAFEQNDRAAERARAGG